MSLRKNRAKATATGAHYQLEAVPADASTREKVAGLAGIDEPTGPWPIDADVLLARGVTDVNERVDEWARSHGTLDYVVRSLRSKLDGQTGTLGHLRARIEAISGLVGSALRDSREAHRRITQLFNAQNVANANTERIGNEMSELAMATGSDVRELSNRVTQLGNEVERLTHAEVADDRSEQLAAWQRDIEEQLANLSAPTCAEGEPGCDLVHKHWHEQDEDGSLARAQYRPFQEDGELAARAAAAGGSFLPDDYLRVLGHPNRPDVPTPDPEPAIRPCGGEDSHDSHVYVYGPAADPAHYGLTWPDHVSVSVGPRYGTRFYRCPGAGPDEAPEPECPEDLDDPNDHTVDYRAGGYARLPIRADSWPSTHDTPHRTFGGEQPPWEEADDPPVEPPDDLDDSPPTILQRRLLWGILKHTHDLPGGIILHAPIASGKTWLMRQLVDRGYPTADAPWREWAEAWAVDPDEDDTAILDHITGRTVYLQLVPESKPGTETPTERRLRRALADCQQRSAREVIENLRAREKAARSVNGLKLELRATQNKLRTAKLSRYKIREQRDALTQKLERTHARLLAKTLTDEQARTLVAAAHAREDAAHTALNDTREDYENANRDRENALAKARDYRTFIAGIRRGILENAYPANMTERRQIAQRIDDLLGPA